ncbi:MAG: hypothetical protein AAF688_00765 [Bacteroidota bacterium]
MKTLLTYLSVIVMSLGLYAQTDGITYQAVIINPEALELPGVDSEGNYLPNRTIAVQFTIFDSTNQVEFQEVQITDTDAFGRINLLIGDGDHDYFKEIEWDGTPKDLKVAIDFDAGNNFETMSRERLTFLPYAYHRNITATGTLTVDDRTFLNGELVVEGPTNLNSTLDVNNQNATNLSGSLTVEGETNLNEAVTVNNGSDTNLSGILNVSGNTLLESKLRVLDSTILNDLEVLGGASFGELTTSSLTVTESSTLLGSTLIDGEGSQVKITSSTLQGPDVNINSYPLLVEGNTQGIAIKINTEGVKNENNFISFWDSTTPSPDLNEPAYDGGSLSDPIIDLFDTIGIEIFDVPTTDDAPSGNTTSYVELPSYDGAPMMWGRIEGETDASEFSNNADYNMDKLALLYDQVDGSLDLTWQSIDLVIAGSNLASSFTDVRVCVGLVPCVVSPSFSRTAWAAAALVLELVKELAAVANQAFAFRNVNIYDYHKRRFKGVSYASGAGDYAEYLLRDDRNEAMSYGDIVSVNGGKITKRTDLDGRKMVISLKPAVLGALPQPHLEKFYEKVAFMGQVPVKVFGKVDIGDYIIPNGENNGIGIAVSPNDIKIQDIKNIVGTAWESSSSTSGFNYINVAVGLNSNDTSVYVEKLENQVQTQSKEIGELKSILEETLKRLTALENGNQAFENFEEIPDSGQTNDGRSYQIENDIIYFEITDADIENGFKLAELYMQDNGTDTSTHFFWKKMREDSAYKAKLIASIKEKLEKDFQYYKSLRQVSVD